MVARRDDAVAALAALGGPVAMKLSGRELRHKSEIGAVRAGRATDEAAARAAYARLRALDAAAGAPGARRAHGGARRRAASSRPARDAVVPALVVGLGGVWTEMLDDVAVIPLPATPERVERALRGLRGAPLLTGGRGRPALDVAAAARLAARSATCCSASGSSCSS